MFPSATTVISLLNRLLEREEWGRQRLQPFGGQTAVIEGGPIQLAMTVDNSGLLRKALPEELPTVTISFGSEAPVKLLTDYPWIRDQVDVFVMRRVNFLPKA